MDDFIPSPTELYVSKTKVSTLLFPIKKMFNGT
jgi:hypothetical protein